jgi:hypothetical protein
MGGLLGYNTLSFRHPEKNASLFQSIAYSEPEDHDPKRTILCKR